MSTTEALKGVIRDLLAAKAELELAGLHFAVERAEAALAAAAPSQKPFAYFVYIADEQRGEFVHSLDEATDELTNCKCEVTELFDHPTAAPSPAAEEPLREQLKKAVTALGDLSFSCFAGIGVVAPSIDIYNRTFSEFQELRAFLAAPGAHPAPTAQPVAWVDSRNLTSAAISRERGGPFDTHAWSDEQKLTDIIAEGIRGAYWCDRVWSAWQVGTMSEDDFTPAEDTDLPGDIARSILAAAQEKTGERNG